MTEQRAKLTDAQWRLLQRAGGYLGDDPDGVAFRCYAGRLAAAESGHS